MKYITTIGGREFEVELIDDDHVIVNGVTYAVDFNSIGNQPVYSMIVDGNSYEAYVYPDDEGWQVLLHGRLFPTTVEDEREKRLRAASGGAVAQRGEFHLKAPMPGLVVAIPVEEGQAVKQGDVLVILESMKMQNELKAPRDGVISRLRVAKGDSVDQRQTLLSVE
ncbi:MAG: biotin/lipoyl-binding protein [Anaerolineales bacterium]|jgi:biotin carboxyl carrier protein